MKDSILQLTSGIFGGVISFAFGAPDIVFFALIACMVIDFLSGITNAIIATELDSSLCARGIAKKIYILLLVAVAHIVDTVLGVHAAMMTVEFFYIANEIISITENAAKIGLPIPQALINILAQLKQKGGDAK